MTGRHDRNDAGVQPRSGQVGVPGAAPDNTAGDADTGPFQAVERTPTGWRVGDEELPDLTSAMVLADILNAELTADEQAELDAAGASAAPPPAPPASQQDAAGRNSGLIAETQPAAPPARDDPSEPRGRRASRRGAHRASSRGGVADRAETEQLKETVAQLERALTVRVRVEQAIGVLAERHRIRPRQAFELLRSASRARGQRIMETASQVIASASNPLLRLPDELAKPPMPRRMPRRSRGEA
jgi:ANTAR domain-containing protein